MSFSKNCHVRLRRPIMILLISMLLVLFQLWAFDVFAQEREKGFSFVVFGDSRSPGYIPYGKAQEGHIRDSLKQILLYTSGSSTAVDEIKLDFKKNGELKRVILPLGQGIVQTHYYEKGWPDLIVRGGTVVMRSKGREWVFKNVVRALKQGEKNPQKGPSFCLNTGDMVYWGLQGTSLEESPYWQQFYNEFLRHIPPSDPDLLRSGLPGRFFPAPGNHETWFDPDLEGLLDAVPYLQDLGFSSENRIYKFDFKNCRFIFLDTGNFHFDDPNGWYSEHPSFAGQMSKMTEWLEEAVELGIRRVFITFHCPIFSIGAFGPPHNMEFHYNLLPFTDDLEITVFTGHVHTTEIFLVNRIRYFLLGGGGGEQDYTVSEHPSDYPEELYWQGQPRVEDYNYLLVRVTGDDMRMWINRFRPGSAKPYEKVEVFEKPVNNPCS